MGRVFDVWHVWGVWHLGNAMLAGWTEYSRRGEVSWIGEGGRGANGVFLTYSPAVCESQLVGFLKKKKYSRRILYVHPVTPSMSPCLPICGLSLVVVCSWLEMEMVDKEMTERKFALLACDHIT